VRKSYNLSIADTTIIFNDALPGEPGVAYFLNGDPVTDTRTPMVVRVNKGECLQVNLTNQRIDKRSGFSVGELLFDPQRSYGAAIGLNHDSTVAPGATRTYEYYADKELGLTLVLNLADSDSLAKGAWGGVVVEKEGSTYRSPGTLNPLPGGGAGIQADIVKNGLATREFVALFMDAEDELNQDRMPYPPAPEFTNSLSYSNEPLSLRNFLLDPANVFRSALHGDPRHVVTVPKGASIIYRAGSPWAETAHLPTLEGHRLDRRRHRHRRGQPRRQDHSARLRQHQARRRHRRTPRVVRGRREQGPVRRQAHRHHPGQPRAAAGGSMSSVRRHRRTSASSRREGVWRAVRPATSSPTGRSG
jgi:hypothetical protein